LDAAEPSYLWPTNQQASLCRSRLPEPSLYAHSVLVKSLVFHIHQQQGQITHIPSIKEKLQAFTSTIFLMASEQTELL
jgi:hypothetical protein